MKWVYSSTWEISIPTNTSEPVGRIPKAGNFETMVKTFNTSFVRNPDLSVNCKKTEAARIRMLRLTPQSILKQLKDFGWSVVNENGIPKLVHPLAEF